MMLFRLASALAAFFLSMRCSDSCLRISTWLLPDTNAEGIEHQHPNSLLVVVMLVVVLPVAVLLMVVLLHR